MIRIHHIAGPFLLFAAPLTAAAYNPTDTHADLAREAIKFYETTTGNILPPEAHKEIVRGATDEDRPPVRVFNHAYDPVHNAAWNPDNWAYTTFTSKEWAQNEFAQTAFPVYGADEPYTWDRAIYYARIGETQKAYYALGHILHLIQDATVPAHTRQDTHPPVFDESDPYEGWSKVFTMEHGEEIGVVSRLFASGEQILKRNSLDGYFDAVAGYTNGFFFSMDSFNQTPNYYPGPRIMRESEKYFYGVDANGKEFPIWNKSNGTNDWNLNREYWLRLSASAVLNGAGVIDLFQRTVEAAKKTDLVKPLSFWENAWAYAGYFFDAMKRITIETGRDVASATVFFFEFAGHGMEQLAPINEDPHSPAILSADLSSWFAKILSQLKSAEDLASLLPAEQLAAAEPLNEVQESVELPASATGSGEAANEPAPEHIAESADTVGGAANSAEPENDTVDRSEPAEEEPLPPQETPWGIGTSANDHPPIALGDSGNAASGIASVHAFLTLAESSGTLRIDPQEERVAYDARSDTYLVVWKQVRAGDSASASELLVGFRTSGSGIPLDREPFIIAEARDRLLRSIRLLAAHGYFFVTWYWVPIDATVEGGGIAGVRVRANGTILDSAPLELVPKASDYVIGATPEGYFIVWNAAYSSGGVSGGASVLLAVAITSNGEAGTVKPFLVVQPFISALDLVSCNVERQCLFAGGWRAHAILFPFSLERFLSDEWSTLVFRGCEVPQQCSLPFIPNAGGRIDVRSLEDGTFAVAWEEVDWWTGDHRGIVFQHVDIFGRPLGEAVRLDNEQTLHMPTFGNETKIFLHSTVPLQFQAAFTEPDAEIRSLPEALAPDLPPVHGPRVVASCGVSTCAAAWVTIGTDAVTRLLLWVGD